METKVLNGLAKELAEMIENQAGHAIKTGKDFCWQEFTPLTQKQEEELDPGVTVSGTIYESGSVVFSIRIDAKSDDGKKKVKEAYNVLKAKNLVLLAVEKKRASEIQASEADELLTEAAGYLGIPVADIEKIVVTESEEA